MSQKPETNPKKPLEWNGIKMEDLRQIMDKPADDAVSSIFESHSMKQLVGILKKMAENDDFVSEDLPEPMRKFAHEDLNLNFSEEDIKYFRQTHEIWKHKGMKFVFILFFRSLPYTYRAEKPANVLRMTKLLVAHAERRIFETGQFVFDVMDEDWWTPKKRGVMTAMKVRIMHSAMRHIILDSQQEDEKWNPEWGKPISQEDLVATNQVFSLEFFKGLELLGDELSEEDQKAWFHTWRTIGKIMGVQPELLSDSVGEAWGLQTTIYEHLFNDENTESGVILSKALVKTMQHFHLPEKLVLLMMRHMLADEQFPDSFHRMLEPSFGAKYPELFHPGFSEEEFRKHFHGSMKEYYATIKEKGKDYKPHVGWFQKIVDWFMNLFGVSEKKQHLIDKHLSLLHNVLHHKDTGNPKEELEEQLILDAMNSMGGIMVSALSVYYRGGKKDRDGRDSGFRIPDSLKANWSLKG